MSHHLLLRSSSEPDSRPLSLEFPPACLWRQHREPQSSAPSPKCGEALPAHSFPGLPCVWRAARVRVRVHEDGVLGKVLLLLLPFPSFSDALLFLA